MLPVIGCGIMAASPICDFENGECLWKKDGSWGLEEAF